MNRWGLSLIFPLCVRDSFCSRTSFLVQSRWRDLAGVLPFFVVPCVLNTFAKSHCVGKPGQRRQRSGSGRSIFPLSSDSFSDFQLSHTPQRARLWESLTRCFQFQLLPHLVFSLCKCVRVRFALMRNGIHHVHVGQSERQWEFSGCRMTSNREIIKRRLRPSTNRGASMASSVLTMIIAREKQGV